MRATTEHVEKLVAEKHSVAKIDIEALLKAIASNDREAVRRANRNFLSSLESLGQVVAREHWPNWLVVLLKVTKNYEQNHANGDATWLAHLKALISRYPEVERHKWFSEESDASAFDVDRIIDEARSAHRIDDLFGRIIETLRALANSGEIDSVKALEDLEEIINILKRAKAGSFSNQIVSWSFTRRFMKNLIKAYVKKSDVIGPIVEALEETSKELDIGLADASADVTRQLRDAADRGFKSAALEETIKQGLPLLEAHSSGEERPVD